MTEQPPSRFKMRREARKNIATSDEKSPPTEEEASLLESFEVHIDAMIDIIEEEIRALQEGEINLLEDLNARKTECARLLENKGPIVEDILNSRTLESAELREKFSRLRDLIAENGVLVERITQASSAIAREINKVRDRHSLKGLYSMSGKKRSETLSTARRFDEKL